MRVVVLISADFRAFGKAFANHLKDKYDGADVIALATTRKVYDDLKNDPNCNFYYIDCMELREREWLAQDYDPDKLKEYEKKLGSDLINRIVVADRQVGAGYVSGARNIQTGLYHQTRDHDKLRGYTTALIGYCLDLIETHKADSAIFYAIAGAYSCAIAEIFQQQGLQAYRLQHARVDNRFIIDPSLTGMLDPLWLRFDNGEKGSTQNMRDAKEWVKDFREKSSKEPDYMGWVRDTIAQNLSPLGIVKNIIYAFARAILYPLMRGQKPLHTETNCFKIKEALVYPWHYFKAAKDKNCLSKEDLAGRDFIYYPLHLDPEASTMHLAHHYVDQLAVLESLSKQRPLHQDIIVKENPFMLGRRPKGYYDFIRNLPGVYIADPAIMGIELVQKCAMVLTLTSTTAWEAMLLGKPSIVLGAFPFLKFKGNIVHCASLNEIGASMEAATAISAVKDSDITRFLSLIFEESFAFDSTLLWGNVDDEAVEKNFDIIENIVSQFTRRYDQSITGR